MRVDVGDRVATGDILAVLDRERLELERDRYASLVTQQTAQLSKTRADLTKTRNDLKRLEGIRKLRRLLAGALRQCGSGGQCADRQRCGNPPPSWTRHKTSSNAPSVTCRTLKSLHPFLAW